MTHPTTDAGSDGEADHRAGLSRRAVIQTGAVAWSVPIIVTATAAPALAVSGGTISVTPGGSAVVSSGEFYDVQLAGLSITCSASIPASTLVLTVSFAPDVDEGDPLIFKQATNPTGWVGPSPGAETTANALIYTYAGAVSAGVPVVFPDGTYFGTNVLAGTDEGEGVFALTFSATGQTSGSATFPTPLDSPRPADRPTAGVRRLRRYG